MAAGEPFSADIGEQPITLLDLAVRPGNCLKRSGIDMVGQVIRANDSLPTIRYRGPDGVREIRERLRNDLTGPGDVRRGPQIP